MFYRKKECAFGYFYELFKYQSLNFSLYCRAEKQLDKYSSMQMFLSPMQPMCSMLLCVLPAMLWFSVTVFYNSLNYIKC